MKNIITLSLIFCLLQHASFAQPGNKQKPAVNPYESSLKNALKEVMAVVDGKANQVKLTGTGTPTPSYGSLDYSNPAVIFPGALTTTLRQNNFKWEGSKGISDWTWTASILQFSKGTQTERLQRELQSLEKLMSKLYPAAVKKSETNAGTENISFTMNNLKLSISASYNYEYSTVSALELTMYFKLTAMQTKQQIADSLQKKLDSELAVSNSPKDKAKKIKAWAETLNAFDFEKQEISSYGTSLLQKIAGTDMNTAYEMIMEWPQGSEEVKKMTDPLSYSQKNIIREKAQKTVNDYNSQFTKKEDDKELQARLQKEKDAKDPCKIGWNVYGYTKGDTRTYNGDYVILKEFNCTKDEYTVWRPAQKRLISGWDMPNISFTVAGSLFRQNSYNPDKRYFTCKACDGDGSVEVTIYTTKTKELPWGYFSGIETKSIKTTSTTTNQTCKVCNGAAVILRK